MSDNSSASSVADSPANTAGLGACEFSFICNLQGVCTYVSPDVQALRGYRPEQLAGKPLYQFMPDESVLLLREMLAEGVDLTSMESPDEPIRFEDKVAYQATCSDGSLRWVETRLTLMRDAESRPTGFLGVTRALDGR